MKAVLDLGTNTFHLLIAELENNQVIEHYQEQIAVKIGAGGINQGKITEEAYQRGIMAIEKLLESIKKFPVNSIIAIGTSAIRNAENGLAFLNEVKDKFGIKVQKITGDIEAELIYQGVSKSFSLPAQPVVVMDIGGGSVELIIGIQNQILWKQSFELGAARLLDKFKPAAQIREEEIKLIDAYLSDSFQPFAAALKEINSKFPSCSTLIGSAGSFESLLDVLKIDLNKNSIPISKHAEELALSDVQDFFRYILNSTQLGREKMRGLLPFRVDMIVVATLLKRHIINNYGLNQIITSRYALKEGLLNLTIEE